MNGVARETRLQIMLDEEELAAIDDWRFQQRMPSRASAIRELLRIALQTKTTGVADPLMRSQDFGIVGNGRTGSEDWLIAQMPSGDWQIRETSRASIVDRGVAHAYGRATPDEVLASSNGAEALEVLATRPDFWAVVSDIAMPGPIDGFELTREVQHRWPGIGIVLVSGQTEPPKSHCPGGVLFLSKPFKASTLLRLLRDIAERRVPS